MLAESKMSYSTTRAAVPNKGYVIKRKTQSLGFTELHGPRTNNYIIGFSSAVMGRKVQYNIAAEPILRLERSDRINITTEVNSCLLELGVMSVNGDINIDVMSKLHVPRMEFPGGVMNPMNDSGFYLSECDLEDLYMMPFEKNIGVVLPYDLLYENNKELVFLSQVIDPVDNIYHFRKTLRV